MRKKAENGVGFGQHATILEADRRNGARGVDCKVAPGLAFALEDTDDFGAIGLLQVLEQQPDLVAVL